MNRRWTPEEAWKWWNERPWMMGLNYVPSCTPGLSIWQEDTRDEAMKVVMPQVELMQRIGFNSVRMQIPFGIWYHDRDRFLDFLDEWLGILDAHGIGMMPVVGNDCLKFGRPDDITIPRLKGPQPFDWGHHGGHADSPFIGDKVRRGWSYWDEDLYRGAEEEFLHALFERFGQDRRVHIWDMWNEPGNSNRYSMSIPYIVKAFEIARSHDPIQPLTACVWRYPKDYGFDPAAQLTEIERLSIDLSDIISFHQYSNFREVKATVAMLEREKRPMANTEWLHRIFDNTVQDNLPLYFDKKIASYHWGLVAGNSQHYLPWDDIKGRPDLDYTRWQHDIFRQDGVTPYDPAEIELFTKYGAMKDAAGAHSIGRA